MAAKKDFNFQKVFEEHPIKACIGCFIFGIVLTYNVCSIYHGNRIGEMRDRYEDKIEFLDKIHQQSLEMHEIKISKEQGTKYYLNIDENSRLGKDLIRLINVDKNEK